MKKIIDREYGFYQFKFKFLTVVILNRKLRIHIMCGNKHKTLKQKAINPMRISLINKQTSCVGCQGGILKNIILPKYHFSKSTFTAERVSNIIDLGGNESTRTHSPLFSFQPIAPRQREPMRGTADAPKAGGFSRPTRGGRRHRKAEREGTGRSRAVRHI